MLRQTTVPTYVVLELRTAAWYLRTCGTVLPPARAMYRPVRALAEQPNSSVPGAHANTETGKFCHSITRSGPALARFFAKQGALRAGSVMVQLCASALLLLLTTAVVVAVPLASSSSYSAAVAQHVQGSLQREHWLPSECSHPLCTEMPLCVAGETQAQFLNKTLAVYAADVAKAAAKGAEIIVFPEFGLFDKDTNAACRTHNALRGTPYCVQMPTLGALLLGDDGVLGQLAASAAEHGLYVAVNLCGVEGSATVRRRRAKTLPSLSLTSIIRDVHGL